MLRSEASNSIYTVFPLPDKSSNKEFIHPDAPCVMYPMGWERSYSFGGLVLNSKAPLEIHARYLNDKIAVFYAKTQQSEDISKSFIIAVFRDMSQAEMSRSHTYRYWKGFEHRVTLKYLQAFPELLVYLKQYITSPLDFMVILNITHSNKTERTPKLFDVVRLANIYLMSCMLADVHNRYISKGRGSFDMHADNSKLYFNMRDSFRDFKPIDSSFLRDTLTNSMFISADMYLYARLESYGVQGFALSCCMYTHADDLASILLNQRDEIDSYLEESGGKTYLRFRSQYGDKVGDRLKAYENMWQSYVGGSNTTTNANIINRYLTNYAYAIKYEDEFKDIYPRKPLRFIYDDGKTTDTKDLNPTQRIKFTRSNILFNYLNDPHLKTIIFSPDTKKYYKEWDVKRDLNLMAEKTKGVMKEIICYMETSGHRCKQLCRNTYCDNLNLDEDSLTAWEKLPDCLSPGTLVVFNYTFEIGILIDIAEDYRYFTYLSIIGDKFRTIYPIIGSKAAEIGLPYMMPMTYITQKELKSDSFREKFPRLYALNRDMLINIKKQ